MASTSSSSESNHLYHADPTIFIKSLSTLQQELSEIDTSSVIAGDDDDRAKTNNQLVKSLRDLSYLVSIFKQLDSFESHVGEMLSHIETCGRDVVAKASGLGDASNSDHMIQLQDKVTKLARSINDLKIRIPRLPAETCSLPADYRRREINDKPYVHNDKFWQVTELDPDYTPLIERLELPLKQLLLYFAAFPHNSVVKKRVLKNWWFADAEPLIRLPFDEAENKANRALQELTLLGLIKPEMKQRRLDGYKMPNPWIHLAVVKVAEQEKLFGFDVKGIPTVDPSFERLCLVHGNIPFLGTQLGKTLVSMFNIGESYPYIRPQLLWESLRVLGLGKWQCGNDFHVEVESLDLDNFLNNPKAFTELRFLSLRGVSRVFELPHALCELSSLTILDLNSCHNLDELPEEIGRLRNLVYLDFSECYLLERMPKGLASLTKLQVLKGFLIDSESASSSSDMKYLEGLKELNKLSVNASSSDFPQEKDLDVLGKFPLLRKLTITWRMKPESHANKAGGTPNMESEIPSHEDKTAPGSNSELQGVVEDETGKLETGIGGDGGRTDKERDPMIEAIKKPFKKLPTMLRKSKEAHGADKSEIFPKLEKLNLQCYPKETAPKWLRPQNMKNLKKLYFVGGKKLRNLNNVQSNRPWTVEILRLKYLEKLQLETNTEHLQAMFPELMYLEKVQHEKLTTFKRDGEGEWVSKTRPYMSNI